MFNIRDYLWDVKTRRQIKKKGCPCIYIPYGQNPYSGWSGKYLARNEKLGWFMPDGTDAIIAVSPKEMEPIK